MINHGRTLLLNRDGNTRPPADFFLEEYIDPSFRALQLPSHLRASLAVIIGAADDAFANFRAWQYMKILHSTEFAEYVLALDSRVTYLHDRSVVSEESTTSYSPISTPAIGVSLFFVGSIAPNLSTPRLLNAWNVEVGGATLVRTTNLVTGRSVDTTISFTSGLSSLIPLAGEKNFFIRIAGDPLPTDAKWMVTAFSQAEGELSSVEAALRKAPLTDAFFKPKEPFKTFKKLWDFHPFLQYRLSGFLLAHIYGVEEVRLSGR